MKDPTVQPWSDMWAVERRSRATRHGYRKHTLSWLYWIEAFQPIHNTAPSINGIEYHGQSILFADSTEERQLLEAAGIMHVWTYIQRGRYDLIRAGRHFGKGVLGHCITLEPWTYSDDEYVVDDLSVCQNP